MEHIFYQPDAGQGILYLSQDESQHCVRVLRKINGDAITVADGKGNFYHAQINNADPNRCYFTIQSVQSVPPRPFYIHIAISPTKASDRTEWMTEKCVEFGIEELTFIQCQRTERKSFNTTRVERVAISAMKQSHQARLPKINGLVLFNTFLQQIQEDTAKYIAYVDHSNPVSLFRLAEAQKKYVVLIGPEGDFSDEELLMATKQGFRKVSLGGSRLRTETAGLAACHVLNLVNSSA